MRLLLGVLALLSGSSDRAFAWFESGHHLIALVAFDQLTVEEQQQLLEILAAHPRYREDFTPLAPIKNVDRWRIGTAAYWPDIARDQPNYNRPTWHYQLGATLTIGDPAQMQIPKAPGPLPSGVSLETQELYIAQAFELCRNVLQSNDATPGDKAIALCWLAHLAGDAHQPCHAGSLYAGGLFPEGDRGANLIPTLQRDNMHALWDSLLGAEYDEVEIANRLQTISDDPRYARFGQKCLEDSSAFHPLWWLSESRTLAKEFTYSHEVLGPLQAAMREQVRLPTLYLSQRYIDFAGKLANVRAIQAGYRLAEVWREGLRSP
ncbi:S1/P1 nuclease [Bythopirellula polymerisocia]|nr:S1/P1 nuclease [Bythopirellula polymerisocia]